MMNDFDRVEQMRNHFLSPEPDEKPVTTCDYCGEELFEGDDFYCLFGDVVCSDCIENMKRTVHKEDFPELRK